MKRICMGIARAAYSHLIAFVMAAELAYRARVSDGTFLEFSQQGHLHARTWHGSVRTTFGYRTEAHSTIQRPLDVRWLVLQRGLLWRLEVLARRHHAEALSHLRFERRSLGPWPRPW